MSADEARRQRRPARPPRRRWPWPLLVAAGLVAFVTAYYIAQIGRTGSALDHTLRSIGYYPIKPPSTLVGPGAIYHVSRDGRFYTTICKPDDRTVSDAIQRSPSEEMIARELQNSKYALGADPAQAINAKLDNDVLESVSYSLTDVSVLEIPLDRNEEIFLDLTARESCRRVVDRLLASREFVCQGQSVLLATVEYQLNAKSGTKIGATLAPESMPLVKAALETSLSSTIDVDEGRFVSGTGLHYGVKVNPMCVTRPEDEYPRHLPRNLFDRFVNFVKLDLLGG